MTPVATFHGQYTPGGAGYDVFQLITPTTLGVGSYEVDEFGLEQGGDHFGIRRTVLPALR